MFNHFYVQNSKIYTAILLGSFEQKDTEIKRTVTVDHIEFVEGISNLDSNNASFRLGN